MTAGTRSSWSHSSLETASGRLIFVIDRDEHGMCSVTNDAEAVVEALHRRYGLNGRTRIVYRDSIGTWDELRHKEGSFAGFRGLGCKSAESAASKVWEKQP